MKVKNTINRKQVLETGIVFGLAVLLAGLITGHQTFYIIASVLLALLLIFPDIFKYPAFIWLGFSRLLGWTILRLMLILLFYLLIVPVGLIRKIAGADELKLRTFKKNTISSWKDRNHVFLSEDLIHYF